MPEDPEELKRLASSPARGIPTDRKGDAAEPGTALCLSGGGYRAMLFHLGALWRLNEFAYLRKLDRISSVSGGSIAASVLAMNWKNLQFNPQGVAASFEQLIVTPIRKLASRTIDVPAVIKGVFSFSSISERVANALKEYLLSGTKLLDIPENPRFIFNATNVQSSVLCRFSKNYIWDYRVGKVENPDRELATAVAASAAFPPFLSPLVLNFKESDFVPGTGFDLQKPPFTTRLFLTDGGVYDNLGLETAWKRYRTILVSDGGAQLKVEGAPKRDWFGHTYRTLETIDRQVRSLRKRQVIGSYVMGTRSGAYWGINSDIANYDLPDALPCPVSATEKLATVKTRLKALDQSFQQRLINWGYAVCDAAIRRHVDHTLVPPESFPYRDIGVG